MNNPTTTAHTIIAIHPVAVAQVQFPKQCSPGLQEPQSVVLQPQQTQVDPEQYQEPSPGILQQAGLLGSKGLAIK